MTDTEFYTNIKGLPEGRNYFTSYNYSDTHAWVEVSRTDKTVTLAAVEVEADPEWLAKKNFIPGGFCGHMANQSEQTWLFKEISDRTFITVRMTKKNGWARIGVRFREGRAIHFYDYNF